MSDEIAKLQAEQAQLQQIHQSLLQQTNEVMTRLVEIQGIIKYLKGQEEAKGEK